MGLVDGPGSLTLFIVSGCSVPSSRAGAGSCFVSTGAADAAPATSLAITPFDIVFNDSKKRKGDQRKRGEKRRTHDPALFLSLLYLRVYILIFCRFHQDAAFVLVLSRVRAGFCRAPSKINLLISAPPDPLNY